MALLFIIKALKLLLLSAGLISLLLLMKVYSCNILVFCTNYFKSLFSSPLYICIIINSIVVLILASSSTFNRDENDNHETFLTNNPPLHLHDPSTTKGIEIISTKNISNVHEQNEDTLDMTWEAIENKRPKRKQLRKSETLNVRHDQHIDQVNSKELMMHSDCTILKEFKKSETFNDVVSMRRLGGLRRDHSMGIDELNKQVEDFIKKFNENMRLQRQESDQRFLDMINRGI